MLSQIYDRLRLRRAGAELKAPAEEDLAKIHTVSGSIDVSNSRQLSCRRMVTINVRRPRDSFEARPESFLLEDLR